VTPDGGFVVAAHDIYPQIGTAEIIGAIIAAAASLLGGGFYRRRQRSSAVAQLAQHCSISSRQAYRYLQQAQRLKEPVPVSEPKLAFTVKLPHSLIQRVRSYASVKRISISEVVSRALLALLPRGGGRG